MLSSFVSFSYLPTGGKKFYTTITTLTQRDPDSMLAAMFSGRHTLSHEKVYASVFPWCTCAQGYVLFAVNLVNLLNRQSNGLKVWKNEVGDTPFDNCHSVEDVIWFIYLRMIRYLCMLKKHYLETTEMKLSNYLVNILDMLNKDL